MASIIPFLPDGMHLRDNVFEAHELKAMSAAFYEVCEGMNLQDDSSAKQIIARVSSTWYAAQNAAPKRLRKVLAKSVSRLQPALKDVSAV